LSTDESKAARRRAKAAARQRKRRSKLAEAAAPTIATPAEPLTQRELDARRNAAKVAAAEAREAARLAAPLDLDDDTKWGDMDPHWRPWRP